MARGIAEEHAVWRGAGTMAALALLVGLFAGVAAILFEFLYLGVFHLVMVQGAGYTPTGIREEFLLFDWAAPTDLFVVGLIAFPAVGGLLSGLLALLAPEVRGPGTNAAIEAYHAHDGFIRRRVPLLKSIATAVTLGFGGSGGREGPIAHICAGVGSWMARTMKLDNRQRRILLAAGMGAGVGAVFKAPLAGALFASEIMYREAEFESDVLLPSFVSSATSYCLFCGWSGSFESLFVTSELLAFTHLIELIPYTVLAALLVPVVWLNINVLRGVERVFDRIPGPRFLMPALGGLLAGAFAVSLWKATGEENGLAVLSLGYGFLQDALDGAFVGWTGVGLLALIALSKILTTAFTVSSGGSGGVFGPAMVIGGGIGGAVGLAGYQLGLVDHPASFVIVGMCGFFSGSAKTPISTIIMISEITGSYDLLMPAMWVCALTFVGCTPMALYRKQVLNRAHSPAHRGEFMVPLLQDMKVKDVVEDRDFPTVFIGTSLKEVVHIVADTHADYFPVLDGDDRFVGIFSAHDVRSFTYDDTLHELAVAADLMVTHPITVTPEDDLHVALQRFNQKNIDELPVVDPADTHRLLGMLRRRAMTRAYDERLKVMQAATKDR